MFAAQPILQASRLLQDDNCSIQDECSSVADSILDIRSKFALVVSEGRQLQRAVLAQQAKIEDLKTRLLGHEHSAEVGRNQLLAQGPRMREYRKSEKLLRLRNQELMKDLEDERAKLDKASHLKCDICMISFKNVVILCGHGFCRKCLRRWLRHSREDESYNGCPSCQQPVQESDLLDVYLDFGGQTSPVGEKDRATQILSFESD
ncbi:hypothetical protein LTR93_010769 [Exophiala xenobiotica]|nr:hypothetical protein LTR93_010769 [Exophiala xenobiotica]